MRSCTKFSLFLFFFISNITFTYLYNIKSIIHTKSREHYTLFYGCHCCLLLSICCSLQFESNCKRQLWRETERGRETANKQVMCSVTCMLIAIKGYAYSMLPVRAHTDAHSHTHTCRHTLSGQQ